MRMYPESARLRQMVPLAAITTVLSTLFSLKRPVLALAPAAYVAALATAPGTQGCSPASAGCRRWPRSTSHGPPASCGAQPGPPSPGLRAPVSARTGLRGQFIFNADQTIGGRPRRVRRQTPRHEIGRDRSPTWSQPALPPTRDVAASRHIASGVARHRAAARSGRGPTPPATAGFGGRPTHDCVR